jgi:hypothetical protein
MSMLAPLYQIYLNSVYYKSKPQTTLTASTQDFTTQHITILSSPAKQNKTKQIYPLLLHFTIHQPTSSSLPIIIKMTTTNLEPLVVHCCGYCCKAEETDGTHDYCGWCDVTDCL